MRFHIYTVRYGGIMLIAVPEPFVPVLKAEEFAVLPEAAPLSNAELFAVLPDAAAVFPELPPVSNAVLLAVLPVLPPVLNAEEFAVLPDAAPDVPVTEWVCAPASVVLPALSYPLFGDAGKYKF